MVTYVHNYVHHILYVAIYGTHLKKQNMVL